MNIRNRYLYHPRYYQYYNLYPYYTLHPDVEDFLYNEYEKFNLIKLVDFKIFDSYTTTNVFVNCIGMDFLLNLGDIPISSIYQIEITNSNNGYTLYNNNPRTIYTYNMYYYPDLVKKGIYVLPDLNIIDSNCRIDIYCDTIILEKYMKLKYNLYKRMLPCIDDVNNIIIEKMPKFAQIEIWYKTHNKNKIIPNYSFILNMLKKAQGRNCYINKVCFSTEIIKIINKAYQPSNLLSTSTSINNYSDILVDNSNIRYFTCDIKFLSYTFLFTVLCEKYDIEIVDLFKKVEIRLGKQFHEFDEISLSSLQLLNKSHLISKNKSNKKFSLYNSYLDGQHPLIYVFNLDTIFENHFSIDNNGIHDIEFKFYLKKPNKDAYIYIEFRK
jgi:hypothetical protein